LQTDARDTIDRKFSKELILIRLLLYIALMLEAVHISETSVNFNLTTRRYIPEDSKLQLVEKLLRAHNRQTDRKVNAIKSSLAISGVKNGSFPDDGGREGL
jgi:hypothetical protein